MERAGTRAGRLAATLTRRSGKVLGKKKQMMMIFMKLKCREERLIIFFLFINYVW